MLDTYFKNKGNTKTIVHNNGVNKIKWAADYNGDVANISIDVDDNGTNEHYTTQLTNEDLDNILNIPSINKPIDQRLLNDFTPLGIFNAQSASPSTIITAPEGGVLNVRRCKIANRKQTPMFIDPDDKIQPGIPQERMLLPLRIRRKYTRRNKTHKYKPTPRTYSSRKHKSSKKSRR